MTRDEVIELAKQAGFADGLVEIVGLYGFMKFANLVAAAEREECAKFCENNESNDFSNNDRGNIQLVRHALCFQLARKIRARGNT